MAIFRTAALALVLASTGTTLQIDSAAPDRKRTSQVSAPAAAAQSCTVTLSPGRGDYSPGSNIGTFIVVTQPGCAWTATTLDPWISLMVASGTGSGVVVFKLPANTLPARTGSITVLPSPS